MLSKLTLCELQPLKWRTIDSLWRLITYISIDFVWLNIAVQMCSLEFWVFSKNKISNRSHIDGEMSELIWNFELLSTADGNCQRQQTPFRKPA